MIHSMSGGVLSEYDSLTFVKLQFDGEQAPYWYITELEVDEGDRVLAPFGVAGLGKEATVIKVERNVSSQVAPVPVKRAKRILRVLDRK
ncbi:MAG: hypothetical protein HDT28_07860 [Clostridiales bacterium]|nr:hypothetical protein [Clostridiales bacterium]